MFQHHEMTFLENLYSWLLFKTPSVNNLGSPSHMATLAGTEGHPEKGPLLQFAPFLLSEGPWGHLSL